MFQSRSGLGVPARGRFAQAPSFAASAPSQTRSSAGVKHNLPWHRPCPRSRMDVAFHGRGGAQLLPAVDLGRPPR